MKKILVLMIGLLLVACNSQKKYSNFDYSYSRSGGYAPVYENFVIKGRNAHYFLEGQGQKIKKDIKLSETDLKLIEQTLTENNFRTIQEDYKKLYDYRSTTIKVDIGNNSGSKTDASLIMPKDQQRWNNITEVFRRIIDEKIPSKK